MKSLDKYRDEIKAQIANGVNFEKDVWQTDPYYFAEIAAKYRYQRPKNAYFGRGRCFYMLLQRVYKQLKARGEI